MGSVSCAMFSTTLWSLFRGLFVPVGYPDSVAPEYAQYQLWDTIQQTTYFVNTVISKRAIMRFHGVGDPNATPLEATALELARGALAQAFSVFARIPQMTRRYKADVVPYRLLSEVLNAIGHFLEILAAIFNHALGLLYAGPMVMNV